MYFFCCLSYWMIGVLNVCVCVLIILNVLCMIGISSPSYYSFNFNLFFCFMVFSDDLNFLLSSRGLKFNFNVIGVINLFMLSSFVLCLGNSFLFFLRVLWVYLSQSDDMYWGVRPQMLPRISFTASFMYLKWRKRHKDDWRKQGRDWVIG